MFEVFTDYFASWLSYTVFGLSAETKLGDAVHFFVEDVSKIFVLLVVMIYIIALLRASLKVESVRDYLAGKNRGIGYLMGSAFGAITPFCSCSSIPVFLGFTSAGIPVGITMSFLLTSPLINEVAVLLLMSLLGWKFTVLYVAIGMTVGILGGFFLDSIRAERWLQSFAAEALIDAQATPVDTFQENTEQSRRLIFKERHEFAKEEALEIFGRVYVAGEQGVSVSVSKETDPKAIMGYGVMSTPAIVIDEKVIHTGSVPQASQIQQWLASA